MAKDGSVAPKERINIKYVPAIDGSTEEVELPLKMVVVGDFKGHEEDTPVEDRPAINVDKQNFNDVMRETKLSVDINVPDRISNENDSSLSVNLKLDTLKDFSPDSIARNVPELNKLLELREALVALKGPLGNIPAFRKQLQDLISDEASRSELAKELENVLGNTETAENKKTKKESPEKPNNS
ncbi:MAG: type VI secretion system contractile sheath small subunit [Methylococcaceae bacterium]